MDLTFFSSDKEQMVRVFVKVEAHTSGKSIKEAFFLIIMELFLFVNNKFEFDDLLRLELILHEVPVGDTAIRGDRIEAKVLCLIFSLPFDLPDRIGVFCGPNGRLINRLVG